VVPANAHKFKPKPPKWIAWSDASDRAIGRFVAELLPRTAEYPILTTDNWLLDASQVFQNISHCAQLQVDMLPWSMKLDVVVRDNADLNPLGVQKVLICHRNLDYTEQALDSTERELLGVLQIISNCITDIRDSTITINVDSMNAAVICAKGSPKPRLNAYARLIFQLCFDNNIDLSVLWIPGDFNQVSDFLSKQVDYEDYSVIKEFFLQV
jgi:hypothetical protein